MGTVERNVDEGMKKMEAQLSAWGAKIDELTAKSKKAGQKAKADYRKRIDDLKAKHRAAQKRFDEYKESTKKKKAGFTADMKAAWKDAERAFKNL